MRNLVELRHASFINEFFYLMSGSSISHVGNLLKVTFELEPSDWHDHATESVWAIQLGEDQYQLQNVPFYAYGVSCDDIVLARPNELGLLIGQGVSARGGHSTYRVFMIAGMTEKDFENAWADLESFGCTYERATDRLIAIDVPPETDTTKLCRFGSRRERQRLGV